MTTRRRNAAIAAAAALILLILLLLWWPRGKAPRDDTPAPPVVVLLQVRASDALPMLIHSDGPPSLADGVFVEDGDSGSVLLAGNVVAALREGKADETFHVETGLRDLAAIGAVVVESIEYTGRGREKPRSRVYLSRELGKPPVHGAAKDIRLSQDDAITGLREVIPWPRDFSWRIGKDGHLIVTAGGKTLTLKPGETGSLPPLSAEVGLRIEEIVIGPGEDPELLVEEKDYGKVRFGTEISIRYLGRMPIKEVQR